MIQQLGSEQQAWRVFVSAHAPAGAVAAMYDHDLASMALLLGVRVYLRPTFYEIRFAVSGPDMAAAMVTAAECWDAAISGLPLPDWTPHRVTLELVTPPLAPVLEVVSVADRPGPGLTSAEVRVLEPAEAMVD